MARAVYAGGYQWLGGELNDDAWRLGKTIVDPLHKFVRMMISMKQTMIRTRIRLSLIDGVTVVGDTRVI